MYLIGSYYHALEQKGRLSFPAEYRKALGNKLVITLGLDGGLLVFAYENWERVATEQINLPFTSKNSRDWVRILTNNASLVEIDKQGRILVPERLREKAGLVKQVVVAGSLNRVEIWDLKTYHQYLDEIEKNKETIAESVAKITNENNQNETKQYQT